MYQKTIQLFVVLCLFLNFGTAQAKDKDKDKHKHHGKIHQQNHHHKDKHKKHHRPKKHKKDRCDHSEFKSWSKLKNSSIVDYFEDESSIVIETECKIKFHKDFTFVTDKDLTIFAKELEIKKDSSISAKRLLIAVEKEFKLEKKSDLCAEVFILEAAKKEIKGDICFSAELLGSAFAKPSAKAVLEVSVNGENAPVEAVFDWSKSFGLFESASIDFGDTTSQNLEEKTVTKIYEAAGNYSAQLILQTSNGEIFSNSVEVTVNEVNPIIDFGVYYIIRRAGDPMHVSVAPNYTQLVAAPEQIKEFRYDLGDGTTLTVPFAESPTGLIGHVYAQQGTYQVTIEVETVSGFTKSATRTIDFINESNPVPLYSLSGFNGAAPLTVTFNGEAYDESGEPITYNWFFPDTGEQFFGTQFQNITHTFTQEGIHYVYYEVRDASRGRRITYIPIYVGDYPDFYKLPPVAIAESTARFGEGPLTVEFSANRSFDPNAEHGNLRYHWNFGDYESGELNYATSANAIHTFNKPGSYFVNLEVISDVGLTHSEFLLVSVDGPEVNDIDFEVLPTGNLFEYSFNAQGYFTETDYVQESARWSFGDNSYQVNQPFVTHQYQVAGTYDVELKLRRPDGDYDSYTRRLIVGASESAAYAQIEKQSDWFNLNQPVQMQAVFTEGVATDKTIYRWAMGDGTIIKGQGDAFKSIVHSYNQIGDRSIKLTITNENGLTSNSYSYIQYNYYTPTLSALNIYYTESPAPVTVQFVPYETLEDGDNNFSHYIYEFGDGSPDLVTNNGFQFHRYEAPGIYQVAVTVVDQAGSSSRFARELVIKENQPPVISDFNFYYGGEVAPATVFVEAWPYISDEDGAVIAFEYIWGDGTSQITDQSALEHTYQVGGDFELKVRVQDDYGNWSDYVSKSITISSLPIASACTIVYSDRCSEKYVTVNSDEELNQYLQNPPTENGNQLGLEIGFNINKADIGVAVACNLKIKPEISVNASDGDICFNGKNVTIGENTLLSSLDSIRLEASSKINIDNNVIINSRLTEIEAEIQLNLYRNVKINSPFQISLITKELDYFDGEINLNDGVLLYSEDVKIDSSSAVVFDEQVLIDSNSIELNGLNCRNEDRIIYNSDKSTGFHGSCNVPKLGTYQLASSPIEGENRFQIKVENIEPNKKTLYRIDRMSVISNQIEIATTFRQLGKHLVEAIIVDEAGRYEKIYKIHEIDSGTYSVGEIIEVYLYDLNVEENLTVSINGQDTILYSNTSAENIFSLFTAKFNPLSDGVLTIENSDFSASINLLNAHSSQYSREYFISLTDNLFDSIQNSPSFSKLDPSVIGVIGDIRTSFILLVEELTDNEVVEILNIFNSNLKNLSFSETVVINDSPILKILDLFISTSYAADLGNTIEALNKISIEKLLGGVVAISAGSAISGAGSKCFKISPKFCGALFGLGFVVSVYGVVKFLENIPLIKIFKGIQSDLSLDKYISSVNYPKPNEALFTDISRGFLTPKLAEALTAINDINVIIGNINENIAIANQIFTSLDIDTVLEKISPIEPSPFETVDLFDSDFLQVEIISSEFENVQVSNFIDSAGINVFSFFTQTEQNVRIAFKYQNEYTGVFSQEIDVRVFPAESVDDCNNDGVEGDIAFINNLGGYISPNIDIPDSFLVMNDARVCGLSTFSNNAVGLIENGAVLDNVHVGSLCNSIIVSGTVKINNDSTLCNLALADDQRIGDVIISGSNTLISMSQVSGNTYIGSDATITSHSNILGAFVSIENATVEDSNISGSAIINNSSLVRDSSINGLMRSEMGNNFSEFLNVSGGTIQSSAADGIGIIGGQISGGSYFNGVGSVFFSDGSIKYVPHLYSQGKILNGSSVSGNSEILGTITNSSDVNLSSSSSFRSSIKGNIDGGSAYARCIVINGTLTYSITNKIYDGSKTPKTQDVNDWINGVPWPSP